MFRIPDSSHEDIDEITLKMASQLMLEKKWDAAESLLMVIIEKDPSNVDAKEMLAVTLLSLNRPFDSALLHEQLLEDDPDNPHLLGMYGIALASAGKEDLGIRALNRSLTIEEIPEYREYFNTFKGSVLFHELSLEHDPDNPYLLAMYGMALVTAGKKDLGIRTLNRSLSIEENPEIRGYYYKTIGIVFRFLEIQGMGRRFRQNIGGHTTTFAITDFLEKIATGCIMNSAAVKVEDLLRESRMNLKQIEEVLPFVEANTETKATFVKLDQSLIIEFSIRKLVQDERIKLTHMKSDGPEK